MADVRLEVASILAGLIDDLNDPTVQPTVEVEQAIIAIRRGAEWLRHGALVDSSRAEQESEQAAQQAAAQPEPTERIIGIEIDPVAVAEKLANQAAAQQRAADAASAAPSETPAE